MLFASKAKGRRDQTRDRGREGREAHLESVQGPKQSTEESFRSLLVVEATHSSLTSVYKTVRVSFELVVEKRKPKQTNLSSGFDAVEVEAGAGEGTAAAADRKSTRLNSSH